MQRKVLAKAVSKLTVYRSEDIDVKNPVCSIVRDVNPTFEMTLMTVIVPEKDR